MVLVASSDSQWRRKGRTEGLEEGLGISRTAITFAVRLYRQLALRNEQYVGSTGHGGESSAISSMLHDQ